MIDDDNITSALDTPDTADGTATEEAGGTATQEVADRPDTLDSSDTPDRGDDNGEVGGQHSQPSGADAALARIRDLVANRAGDDVDAYHAAELLFVNESIPAGLRAAADWLDKRPDFVPRALWLEPVPGGRDAVPQWAVHLVVETE